MSGTSLRIAFLVPVLVAHIGSAAERFVPDPALAEKFGKRRPGTIYDEAKLPAYVLPDALRMSDGSVVKSPQQWRARRAEILEMFRGQMYGRSPGRPQELRFELLEEDPKAMEGAATLKRVAIHSRQGNKTHQFELILFLPNAVKEPAGVFLQINNRGRRENDPTRQHQSDFWPAEQVIARGWGIAAFQNSQLAPDDAKTFREGVMRLFEDDSTGPRPSDAWGALAAWAWGASRAMDYLETDPHVDKHRVAVLGHSRGGKTALWAAAEDERFFLAVSNASGCGGAALSKRRWGETVKILNDVRPHWFCDNFKQYNGREDDLPFDQQMLIGLIAPRAVYVASGSEDLPADPRGEFLSLAHASPVYALWGHDPIAPDAMPPLDVPLISGPRGYHIHTGPHALTLADWRHFTDFAERLKAKPARNHEE